MGTVSMPTTSFKGKQHENKTEAETIPFVMAQKNRKQKDYLSRYPKMNSWFTSRED